MIKELENLLSRLLNYHCAVHEPETLLMWGWFLFFSYHATVDSQVKETASSLFVFCRLCTLQKPIYNVVSPPPLPLFSPFFFSLSFLSSFFSVFSFSRVSVFGVSHACGTGFFAAPGTRHIEVKRICFSFIFTAMSFAKSRSYFLAACWLISVWPADAAGTNNWLSVW